MLILCYNLWHEEKQKPFLQGIFGQGKHFFARGNRSRIGILFGDKVGQCKAGAEIVRRAFGQKKRPGRAFEKFGAKFEIPFCNNRGNGCAKMHRRRNGIFPCVHDKRYVHLANGFAFGGGRNFRTSQKNVLGIHGANANSFKENALLKICLILLELHLRKFARKNFRGRPRKNFRLERIIHFEAFSQRDWFQNSGICLATKNRGIEKYAFIHGSRALRNSLDFGVPESKLLDASLPPARWNYAREIPHECCRAFVSDSQNQSLASRDNFGYNYLSNLILEKK